ncbi:hypothetical protein ABW19_dt0201836 [Dactylella cylindrospora]|nr:hypothetical protein ABW19_dt0201836 [Dactylella cylindrospora]
MPEGLTGPQFHIYRNQIPPNYPLSLPIHHQLFSRVPPPLHPPFPLPPHLNTFPPQSTQLIPLLPSQHTAPLARRMVPKRISSRPSVLPPRPEPNPRILNTPSVISLSQGFHPCRRLLRAYLSLSFHLFCRVPIGKYPERVSPVRFLSSHHRP